jgi:hypothetical protein
MNFAMDVRRPPQVLRIHWTHYSETALRPLPRRLQQQTPERRLPVLAVGAQVAQVPPRGARLGPVPGRVHGAVQRPRPGRPVCAFDRSQNRSAGEGKIQIIPADQLRRDVVVPAFAEHGESHRGIDVVKSADSPGHRNDPIAHTGSIRNEGPDNDQSGLRHFPLEAADEIVEAFVNFGPGSRRVRLVAVACVPGCIPFEKEHTVSASRQPPYQASVRGGMAVSPGGSHRKAEDDHVERPVHDTTPWAILPSSTASTMAARRP